MIDVVSWYAINDPDPVAGKEFSVNGNPHHTGINSTRGSMAGALAQLLFDNPARLASVAVSVDSVAHDESIAVRACAPLTLF